MSSTLADGIVDVHIGGDVTGQIAVGHHIVQVVADHGAIVNVAPPEEHVVPRLRPGPAHRLPRPFPGLIGREPEVDSASTALRSGGPVEFYADAGWGKSALLRYLAHQPETSGPSGVIYNRFQGQPTEDLLQLMFESLYETDAPFKPSPAQLRQYLQDPEPLVVLDDLDVPRDDVQMLVNAAPRARFLVASSDRNLWGEGSALALRGLTEDAGVALIERELGRALAPQEVGDAQALCRALEGHPLRVLQAAALVGSKRRSLAELVAAFSSVPPANAMIAAATDSLDEPERVVAGMLAGLGGTSVRADLVARLSEIPAGNDVLDSLLRRGLVKEDDGRYRSAEPNDFTASLNGEESSTWRRKLIALLPVWLEEHRDDPNGVLDEAELLHAALGWAAEAQDWDAVVDLGRRVAPWFLLGARWGSWERVVRRVLEAARVSRDRAAEAWSLNELAIHRALWDQELDVSAALLTEAIELWASINDDIGARIARHNRAVLVDIPPPPPPPDGSEPPKPSPPWGRIIVGLLATTLAVVGAILAWRLVRPDTVGIALKVDGDGIVNSVPAGIDCPGDCTESFGSGTSVAFTAIADEGWELAVWNGACAGTPVTEPCILDVTSDASVGATFEQSSARVEPTVTVGVLGSGTITSTPSGISCPGDCSGEFPSGTTVILTADPDEGWKLSGWGGTCEETAVNEPCVLELTTDGSVRARFEEAVMPATPTVTVWVVGNGTVISTPSGIDCLDHCTEDFRTGTDLVFRAHPDEGWELWDWSGTCAGTPITQPCALHLTMDESVTATFQEISVPGPPTVGVRIYGSGAVTSDPSGIGCRDDCSTEFPIGTTVTLTADPDEGWELSGWGGSCSGTPVTRPCSFDVMKDVSVSATFEMVVRDLRVTVEGQGAVTSAPPGIGCRDDCSAEFPTGTTVTLTADPDEGWELSGWSGTCAGTPATGPCVLDLTKDISVAATFEQIVWNLRVTVDGQGIVTSNPSGISCRDDCSAEFATGTTVTLTADPDTWWYLLSWGGACANTPANEPCVLDVTQNVTVTANFAAAPG